MMYEGWEAVSAHTEPASSTAPFVTQLREFAKNVRAKVAGENSLARNLNTIAVVEAITNSLASGKPEPVATR